MEWWAARNDIRTVGQCACRQVARDKKNLKPVMRHNTQIPAALQELLRYRKVYNYMRALRVDREIV